MYNIYKRFQFLSKSVFGKLGFQGFFTLESNNLLQYLSVFDNSDFGDTSNFIFLGVFFTVININGNIGPFVLFHGQFFENGGDFLAGRAPFGSELNNLHSSGSVSLGLFRVGGVNYLTHNKLIIINR